MAEWVGVDGASNADTSLIQAGVDEFSDPSNPTDFDLQAWWEILPAAETNITTVTVKAGDSITVTLWQVSSTSWEIDLSDNTNGESFTTPPGAVQRAGVESRVDRGGHDAVLVPVCHVGVGAVLTRPSCSATWA